MISTEEIAPVSKVKSIACIRPVIELNIKDKKLSTFVVTMIKEQACNQLGKEKCKPCHELLVSYTQDEIQTVGKVSLVVKICKKIQVTHDFIVVPDRYMDTDVLLGAGLIGRAPFAWNAEANEIRWGTAKYRVNGEGNKSRMWEVRVAKQKVVVDGRNFIQANK